MEKATLDVENLLESQNLTSRLAEKVAVTTDQWRLIQPHEAGIYRIFGVEMTSFPAPIGTCRAGSSIHLQLSGPTEEALDKARGIIDSGDDNKIFKYTLHSPSYWGRGYLAAVCLPEADLSSVTLSLPMQVVQAFLRDHQDHVERVTGALLRSPDESTLLVSSTEKRKVQAAYHLIQELLERGGLIGFPPEGKIVMERDKLRLKDSTDSCYDTDSEASPSGTSGGTQVTSMAPSYPQLSSACNVVYSTPVQPPRGGNDRNELFRTFSETLGAEFKEHITRYSPHQHPPLPSDLPGIRVGPPSPMTPGDDIYLNRLEFGLKLGYQEEQVQAVISKLGIEAENNKILAELIQLGTAGRDEREGTSSPRPHSLISSSRSTPDLIASTTTSPAPQCTTATSTTPCSTAAVTLAKKSNSQELKHIIIDGSNLAMSHGNKETFSCRGIKLAVDYFKERGHEITVFVPKWRKEMPRPEHPIKDQEILTELEKERVLVWTPSRTVSGRRVNCYDDRYVLELAEKTGGVVVSNDTYRDLVQENSEFRKIVEERLLMYTFVNDIFMPPEDPLGRTGPSLSAFLRKSSAPTVGESPPCPYGKKCTYGNKCKFFHPERGNQPQKLVSERLAERAQQKIKEVKARKAAAQANSNNACEGGGGGDALASKLSLPADAGSSGSSSYRKKPLSRTHSNVPSVVSTSTVTTLTPYHSATTPPPPLLSTESQQSPSTFAPRSHSMDNILGANPPPSTTASPVPPYPVARNLQVPPPFSPFTPPPPVMGHRDRDGSLHRKLERQLTLNPLVYDYDPHVYDLPWLGLDPKPEKQPEGTTPSSHLHQHLSPFTPSPLNPHSRILSDNALFTPPPVTTSGPPPLLPSTHDVSQPPQPELLRGGIHPMATATTSLPLSFQPSAPQPLLTRSQVEDSRLKLYYHLSHIFPEEQVRSAMAQHPEETSAERICKHLNHSMASQHPQLGRISSAPPGTTPSSHLHQHLSPFTPSPLNPHSRILSDNALFTPPPVTTSGPPPLLPSTHDVSQPPQPELLRGGIHPMATATTSLPLSFQPSAPQPLLTRSQVEDSRLKLYYHLSHIFPEEQVRSAMAQHPEETSAERICKVILFGSADATAHIPLPHGAQAHLNQD
ncbi:unnamed protein product [Cyprideis torosa]|uniref:Uncharacterized protein n=1 Tax=Cyprideis torosa TaxID=163714 RepID=A0A7R8WCP3_9CRUS|nr:unnamed protein product [Cyprideis torosa]CAG0887564.1 unnamed protein product [Cyprideis torosa]